VAAAYDTFDYPSYWIGRDYEHKSEIIAIKHLLGKIKKIKTILEVGAGFGRLVPTYSFRAKKIILTDPSSRSLKIARSAFRFKKNFKFIHTSLENLPNRIRSGSIDLIVMVRVLHHLSDVDLAFKILNRTLKPDGYIIFEFANKKHLKSTLKHILRGDLSFIKDKTTTDIRSKKAVKKGTLPFLNYHPEKIKAVLAQFGFEVIEELSVSNIRSKFLKRFFSTELLISLEKILQKPFAYPNLGPSIFILAQKRG
jgi:ubiquinone/menaquinone biosynthesis C-methylase UbiE